MSNRVTLAELVDMPIKQMDNLPVAHLAMLLDDVAELKAQAKKFDDFLNLLMARRFAEAAQSARRTEAKDFGTVRLAVDGYEVVCDLPKKVEYDQAKAREGVEALRSWGENPDDYVSTEIKIAEARWNAWPPRLRQVFEAARTVKPGKQSFKIIPAKQEAA